MAFVGSTFVWVNVVANVLDLLTSIFAFSKGMPEQNSKASAFMRLVGNDTLGGIILKVFVFALLFILLSAIRESRSKNDHIYSRIFGLVVVDIILFYFADYFVNIVLGNLVALGWL